MTIKKCKTRIGNIKQSFRDYFTIDFDVGVSLLEKASVKTKRPVLFET